VAIGDAARFLDQKMPDCPTVDPVAAKLLLLMKERQGRTISRRKRPPTRLPINKKFTFGLPISHCRGVLASHVRYGRKIDVSALGRITLNDELTSTAPTSSLELSVEEAATRNDPSPAGQSLSADVGDVVSLVGPSSGRRY